MYMADNHIPKSWCLVRLGDFVENEKGKKPKNQQEKRDERYCYPYVDIEAFEDNVIKSYADGINCRFCSTDDFLMVWDGSRSGLVGKGIDGALGSTLIRINFPGIHNDYAYYFLQSKYLQINSRAKGSGTPHVDPDLLWNYSFPIPPLNEQHRIVAKIEELFSELDKGVESLKKAREQLKVYRQALLKHAFEGKLTEDWRKKNADKLETADQLLDRIKHEREARYQQQLEEWKSAVEQWEKDGKVGKRPAKPKPISQIKLLEQSKLSKLPVGWLWFSVSQLCDVVRGGSPRPAGDPEYYNGDIPFLKVADITRSQGAYLDAFTYTIKEAGLQKTRLVKPPVLMLSNSGATLGVPKICQIETTFNDGIAAFLGLPDKALLYHYYFWESETMALRNINQGAAQPNLNTNLIQEYILPICSEPEMAEVSKMIEQGVSICAKLEDDISNQLKVAQSLRQSILKKAFSGQLVPQDPNDEPASVLLERIAREKAEVAVTAKKGRGPKKIIKQKAYEHL